MPSDAHDPDIPTTSLTSAMQPAEMSSLRRRLQLNKALDNAQLDAPLREYTILRREQKVSLVAMGAPVLIVPRFQERTSLEYLMKQRKASLEP